MRTAPFSDGTAQVSQWPIAPGEFFDYEIHPDIGDAGTYFYHSHIGFQAVTAHGILYVEDAGAPPYQYDGDLTMAIGDVYVKTDQEVESGLLADPFVWSGEPDALIINDKTGTSSLEDAPDDSCTPYVFTVEPGLTYRFRFVGATVISFVQVGIEEHTNLTVIAADGYYTKPAAVDHIQIGSGQRYDVLFTTKSEAELVAEGRDQYWIRFENRGRATDLSGYALLQYERPSSSDATSKRELTIPLSSRPFGRLDRGLEARAGHELPHKSPVTLPPDGQLTDWLEYTLEALNPKEQFPTLSEVTRTICITVEEKIVNGTIVDGTITGSMIWINNGLKWTETEAADLHYTPYLIDAYVNGKTPNYTAAEKHGGWDPATKAFPAEVGEVLDIVWLSNSGPTGGFQYHPMHAHGKHYYDLGSGNGTYDPAANEAKFKNYTPATRDTTMLFRYASQADTDTTAGWRAWRIRVTEDNVGAWMMHCHILQHMIMGMQTIWVFGDATTILREIPEPYISGYLEYGGSAYGNESYDPLVLTYFDE